MKSVVHCRASVTVKVIRNDQIELAVGIPACPLVALACPPVAPTPTFLAETPPTHVASFPTSAWPLWLAASGPGMRALEERLGEKLVAQAIHHNQAMHQQKVLIKAGYRAHIKAMLHEVMLCLPLITCMAI